MAAKKTVTPEEERKKKFANKRRSTKIIDVNDKTGD